ncbi:DUF1232 domain-containing protein [Brevibacillus laterosporus]|uniref:DUF1232 domain-containing protein n=1 Tax=Brevibacillus laterosporus TaxID=1465 RepID=A0A502HMT3_BRELA|nr:DUF1232 domain-containing protein [Brevibacillus laterosporus]QDX94116.1 DUF1232 domain-containing protein [Brevibacillus laterosporus]RAP25898.1 hypothetical protein C2W64_02258 [Brevibacillus laterosporus]TPG68051.1 DUF1232 domain-containing protein [Brevibacillus laterosporus]TPG75961.1 DUF1232 domain-containing protein [Brevibacillus laterosporus]
MENEPKETGLGILIKKLLQEQSMSMRTLSKQSRINVATISRIINGKQTARPKHLEQIGECLGVSMDRLFLAAGYPISTTKEFLPSDIHTSVDKIQKVLESSQLFDWTYTTEQVQLELEKYERHAQTREGSRIIREEFQEKVETVNGEGPFIDQLKEMYVQFCHDETQPLERAVIGSALLYFILSVDIIPDYVFPIGYLDDAIAVQLTLQKLGRLQEKEEKGN